MHGSLGFGASYSSWVLSESREVFGLRMESPKNELQGSVVFGGGFYWLRSFGLIKAHLIYVINFQNTMSGEYMYGNLLVSDDSRGDYDVSGNHLSLLISYTFKRKNRY